MDGTVGQFTTGPVPEKRACVRELLEDTLVIEKFLFLRINCDRGIFPGILVVDKETVIAVFLFYAVYETEILAAFPALEAFEPHCRTRINGAPAR